MLSAILNEVRGLSMDDASLAALADCQARAIEEVLAALPEGLAAELKHLDVVDAHSSMTRDEVRVEQAQLVGWLQGLLHGLQLAIG